MKGIVYIAVTCVFAPNISTLLQASCSRSKRMLNNTNIHANTVMSVEQKQVNIALETVLQFGKKNPTTGLEVIDKLQTALRKIKDDIEFQNGRRSNPHDITFTDFVSDAAKILKDFNDEDLEEIFVIISDESRRFINRKSEFQKLLGTGNARRHLTEQLNAIQDMEASKLRQHLDTVITAVDNKKHNGENNDLLDIGNFVYIDRHDKLKTALKNLERLQKSTDVPIKDVLKDTLSFLIFDHFSELNDNIKVELIEMAKDYFKIYGGKKRSKVSQSPTPNPLEVVGPQTLRTHKHHHRNRINLKAERRPISHYRTQHRTNKKTHKTGHANKRYKYKSKIQKDRDAITTKSKIYALNDDSASVSREIINSLLGSESDKEISHENVPVEKRTKIPTKNIPIQNNVTYPLHHSKLPKPLREDKATSSFKPDLMFLTGGQHTQEIDVRGKDSGEEISVAHDKKKEKIHVSNKTVAVHQRPTAGYISVERFITKKKPKTSKVIVTPDETEDVTTTVMNISGEGLSIEGFEKDVNIKARVIRKKVDNDTLKIDNYNVKNMIKNIEKQIEDVRNQVNYVKNLTVDISDNSSKTVLRAYDTDTEMDLKPKYRFKSKSKTKTFLNSDSLERNNEEFFTRDSSERVTEMNIATKAIVTFRAHDTSVQTTILKIDQNNSTKSVRNILSKTTQAMKVKLSTKHENSTVKSSFIQNDETIINNTTNIVLSNITQNIKANDKTTDTISTVNMKSNEIDTENTVVTRSTDDYTYNPLTYNFTTHLDDINDDRDGNVS